MRKTRFIAIGFQPILRESRFRWVACQLDALAEYDIRYRLFEALETLPTTLSETYKRILQRIPESHREDTARLLQFLVYSKRPLTIKEALDVLAVTPHRDQTFDEENRPRKILKYCSNLAAISDDGEIRLAHFSVKEYLVSTDDKGPFTKFLIESEAEVSITEISLAYLSCLIGKFDPDQDYESWDWHPPWIRKTYPLADYCAKYWMDHARVAEKSSEAIREQIIRFISRPGEAPYFNCLTLFHPDRPDDSWFGFEQGYMGPPLYLASLTGLRCAVEHLIAKGTDVNEVCEYTTYGYALRAACEERHAEVIRILLDNGANVDLFGGEHGSTALLAAVSEGLEDVAQLLLNRGANPNIKGSYRDGNCGEWFEAYPLRIVASNGSEELAKLLLEKGAEINNDDEVGPALVTACWKGREEMVRLLLDHGAVDNPRDNYGERALVIASRQGHKKIVQALINHHSSNACTHDACNRALFVAQPSTQGGQEIIELLLENGADINTLAGGNKTPLENAATMRDEPGALFLIEKGATLFRMVLTHITANSHSWTYRESPTSSGERLFQVACQNGWANLVLLLLERDNDVQYTQGLYGDGLQTASYLGHEKIVELLLSTEFNINAEPGEYGNPLQAASSTGHLDIVKRLLARGADANRVDKHGWSALSIAFKNSHASIFGEILRVSAVNTLVECHNSSRCLTPLTFVTYDEAPEVRIYPHERIVEAG